jgi:hypothetical protein
LAEHHAKAYGERLRLSQRINSEEVEAEQDKHTCDNKAEGSKRDPNNWMVYGTRCDVHQGA